MKATVLDNHGMNNMECFCKKIHTKNNSNQLINCRLSSIHPIESYCYTFFFHDKNHSIFAYSKKENLPLEEQKEVKVMKGKLLQIWLRIRRTSQSEL